MKKHFLVLFCLVHFFVYSQPAPPNDKLDSLVKANQQYLKQDEYKFDLLLALADQYANANRPEGITTGKDALALAKKLNKLLEAKANLSLGTAYIMRDDRANAKGAYLEAERLYGELKDMKGVAAAQQGLGNSCGDKKEALVYFEKALSTYSELKDKRGMAGNMQNIGLAYITLGNNTKALAYLEKGLAIFTEIDNKYGIGGCLDNIGLVHSAMSNYPAAIDCHQKAITVFEEIGNLRGTVQNLNNIGNIFMALEDYPKARDYYEKALRISEVQNDRFGIAILNGNIGFLNSEMEDYPKALGNFQQAFALFEEMNMEANMGMVWGSLGKVYLGMKDYAKSFEYAKKSLVLCEKYGIKEGLAQNLQTLSTACLLADAKVLAAAGISPAKRYSLALDYAEKSLQLNKEMGNLNLQKENWWNLSTLYEKQGEPVQALDAYKTYVSLRDSIIGLDAQKQITRNEMQFAFGKKEAATKAEQEQKDAIARQELQRQKLIRNIIMAGLAVAVILLVIIFRQRQKVKQTTAQLQVSLVEKEALLREIHHRVKNNLEVISSLLTLQTMSMKDETGKAALAEGQSRVQSVALIHHKLYGTDDLSAVELKGFVQDLFKQVKDVFKAPGTEVELKVNDQEVWLPTEASVPFGLILNELFTNIFKYAVKAAQMNEISISLAESIRDDQVFYQFVCRDNGPGLPDSFDPKSSGSMGMKVIQLLTRQLKGKSSFYNDGGLVFDLQFSRKQGPLTPGI